MRSDVRHNPGLLKLDLFCRGMQLDSTCDIQNDGRPILRTRAGLGSGVEMILPRGICVNAPVEEDWCKRSPYLLTKKIGSYCLLKEGRYVCDIVLPRQPLFYRQRTSSGKLMSRIGVLQGTYLGIYPGRVCHHWREQPRSNCKFCSVGLNIGEQEEAEKSVADVVETVKAARRQEKITFVHFNTGYYEGDTYLDDLEPFVKAVKKETKLLIGVQAPPHPDLSRYDKLRALGVNNVSFCFEIWDEDIFREVCPGKARNIGQQRYFDAIEYCARIFDTTNGEIVAGLEPPESSIEAINWITAVGAVPTVCVFRPLRGTDYERRRPPSMEDMIPVFRRVYEACMGRGLPIGMAPNIRVSIAMLPEECRYLCDDAQYRIGKAKLTALSAAFRTGFEVQQFFH